MNQRGDSAVSESWKSNVKVSLTTEWIRVVLRRSLRWSEWKILQDIRNPSPKKEGFTWMELKFHFEERRQLGISILHALQVRHLSFVVCRRNGESAIESETSRWPLVQVSRETSPSPSRHRRHVDHQSTGVAREISRARRRKCDDGAIHHG